MENFARAVRHRPHRYRHWYRIFLLVRFARCNSARRYWCAAHSTALYRHGRCPFHRSGGCVSIAEWSGAVTPRWMVMVESMEPDSCRTICIRRCVLVTGSVDTATLETDCRISAINREIAAGLCEEISRLATAWCPRLRKRSRDRVSNGRETTCSGVTRPYIDMLRKSAIHCL